MKFWPRRPDAVDEEIRGHIEMAVRERMLDTGTTDGRSLRSAFALGSNAEPGHSV